jgi:hypothetical protein
MNEMSIAWLNEITLWPLLIKAPLYELCAAGTLIEGGLKEIGFH